MIFKNLWHRKGRTLLTAVGISIGVAAIVALGAISQGLRAGLSAMMEGSQADLVVMQGDAFSFLLSSVDEGLMEQFATWGEVDAVNGMLFTNALMDDETFVMIFGHDPEGFAIAHYRVIAGQTLVEARQVRGKPILLGRRLVESLGVQVGDTMRITGTSFRVVGIYETGDSFEDGATVMPLDEAQALDRKSVV